MYNEPYPQDYDEADNWKNKKDDRPIGDNFPVLPEEDKNKSRCPKCGHSHIVLEIGYGSIKFLKSWCCTRCGFSWKGNALEMAEKKTGKPISWDDVLDFKNELKRLPTKEI